LLFKCAITSPISVLYVLQTLEQRISYIALYNYVNSKGIVVFTSW